MILLPIGQNLKRILTFYHVTNIILCVAYYFSRVLTPLCHVIYGQEAKCSLGQREYEIFLLLSIVIYVKNRKATSFLHYLSNVFVFGKLANFFMFYWSDPSYAIIYAVVAIILMVLFPEPAYKGPENVTYFRGPNLKEEIERDTSITWIIEFYAGWSPLCQQIAPVFADLSLNYSLPNLKFAKMDISRYPKEAEKFRINIHATSRQLPTISMFQNGKEVKRKPNIDSNHRAISYIFKKENIIVDFDLNTLYADCNRNSPKKGADRADKSKNE